MTSRKFNILTDNQGQELSITVYEDNTSTLDVLHADPYYEGNGEYGVEVGIKDPEQLVLIAHKLREIAKEIEGFQDE